MTRSQPQGFSYRKGILQALAMPVQHLQSLALTTAGTPLEVRRRRAATPLLYVMTVLWILQAVFMSESQLSTLPRPQARTPSLCLGKRENTLTGASSRCPLFPWTNPPCGLCCAVYGTVVAHTVYPSCWEGSDARHIPRVIKAMVYSTWIFSFLLA